jgi:hypothetical protein
VGPDQTVTPGPTQVDTATKKYVGDIHEFKQDILGKRAPIAQYDVYVDTNTGNIYLNSKSGAAVNAIETGVNRDGGWVDPPGMTDGSEGPEGGSGCLTE